MLFILLLIPTSDIHLSNDDTFLDILFSLLSLQLRAYLVSSTP
jgi:hypothetical protein